MCGGTQTVVHTIEKKSKGRDMKIQTDASSTLQEVTHIHDRDHEKIETMRRHSCGQTKSARTEQGSVRTRHQYADNCCDEHTQTSSCEGLSNQGSAFLWFWLVPTHLKTQTSCGRPVRSQRLAKEQTHIDRRVEMLQVDTFLQYLL